MRVAPFKMHGMADAQGRVGHGPLRLHGPANAEQDRHDERHQAIGLPKHHEAPGFRIAQKALQAPKEAPGQPRIFHRGAVDVLRQGLRRCPALRAPFLGKQAALTDHLGDQFDGAAPVIFDIGINRRLANGAFEIAVEVGGRGHDYFRPLKRERSKPFAVHPGSQGIGRSKVEAEARSLGVGKRHGELTDEAKARGYGHRAPRNKPYSLGGQGALGGRHGLPPQQDGHGAVMGEEHFPSELRQQVRAAQPIHHRALYLR